MLFIHQESEVIRFCSGPLDQIEKTGRPGEDLFLDGGIQRGDDLLVVGVGRDIGEVLE